MSEAEGGCQERWQEGATSSSQERWQEGGGVQLVVFGKISSQEIYCSQPLFYLTVKLARLEVKGDESGRPV